MGTPGYYAPEYMPPYHPQQPPQPYMSTPPPSYPYQVAAAIPVPQPPRTVASPPPPPQYTSAAMAPQDIRRAIGSMLAQTGPNALPYDEADKNLVKEQLAHAAEHFPQLHVKPSRFTHNDGRTVTLLQMEGTIPVNYKGSTYNIPVTLWMLESFPKMPPLVYVTPTRDMIIRPRHSHVDGSGLVDVPYLRDWVYRTSSIADLIQVLCIVFGQETPLYSRQQQPPQPRYQQPHTTSQHTPPPPRADPRRVPTSALGPEAWGGDAYAPPASGSYDSGPSTSTGPPGTGQISSFSSSALANSSQQRVSPSASADFSGGRTSGPPGSVPGSVWGQQDGFAAGSGEAAGAAGAMTGPATHGGSFGASHAGGIDGRADPGAAVGVSSSSALKVDVVEVFRRNALSALRQRLERDVAVACEENARKMESMLGMQQFLSSRKGAVDAEVRELQQEKGALEQALQACLTQAHAIESWLSANQSGPAELDADTIFEPADSLSRQLLDVLSSDLAIEDTLYSLDRALQEDVSGAGARAVPADLYLRTVRSLAREQFFFRALEEKIRAAQRSARVARMAAAAPVPGAVPGGLPTGRPMQPGGQRPAYPPRP